MDDHYDKQHIPTLARDNWEIWFRQTKLKLKSKGVWYTVEKTVEEHAWVVNQKSTANEDTSAATSSRPPTWESGGTWNTEKKDTYDKDQASALLYMTLTMSKDDGELLDEYETAKALWAGLRAKYSKTSESTANTYLSKITQFEFDESSGIDGAWSKLKEYRRKLISANTDMKNAYSDKALFLVMTRSLPVAYKPTVDTFRLAPSMDIEEKLRILHEVEEDTKAETAMIARQHARRAPRHRSDSNSSANSNGCYLCGNNHTVRHCKYLGLARSIIRDVRRTNSSKGDKKTTGRADQSSDWRSKDNKPQDRKYRGYAAVDQDDDTASSPSDHSGIDEECHLSQEEIHQ